MGSMLLRGSLAQTCNAGSPQTRYCLEVTREASMSTFALLLPWTTLLILGRTEYDSLLGSTSDCVSPKNIH